MFKVNNKHIRKRYESQIKAPSKQNRSSKKVIVNKSKRPKSQFSAKIFHKKHFRNEKEFLNEIILPYIQNERQNLESESQKTTTHL